MIVPGFGSESNPSPGSDHQILNNFLSIFTFFQNFFKTKNMDANDSFDGKPTNVNCFYMHTIFEQKYLKPAIVLTYPTKYSKASRYTVFGSRKKPCSSKPRFMRFIPMY